MSNPLTADHEQKARLLASQIWHAMTAAPKYIDGQAIGNCEALKAGAAILKSALADAYKCGGEDAAAFIEGVQTARGCNEN